MFDLLWPFWLCRSFRNYVVNGAVVEKNVFEIKVVLISMQHLYFLLSRQIQRDITIKRT
jgi:hypothetical protein